MFSQRPTPGGTGRRGGGVVLRDLSDRRVATRLGLSLDGVCKRYSRALQRLRAVLPDSVFGELGDG